MKLLLNLRRKSARRALSASSDIASTSETEKVDIAIECPPPPTPSPSSIYVSRCSSLTSMDSMAAALALTPVTLNFADNIGRSSFDSTTSSSQPSAVGLPESPKAAPLIATVGPTKLRSNIQCSRKPRKIRPSKSGAVKRVEDELRDDLATTLPSADPSSTISPTRAYLNLPDLAVRVPRRKSSSVETSAASTPFAMTPADLTPSSEVDLVLSPLGFTDVKTSGQLPSPISPRRRSSAEEAIEAIASFAPLLAPKPAFSSTRPACESPTGSSFGGGDSMSPTFSFLDSSDESRPRRSLGSLFAREDSPVTMVFNPRLSPGPSSAWPTGDMLDGDVILLDSPTFEADYQNSSFAKPRSTSARSAERRPVNLNLGSASRRPHSRQLRDAASSTPVTRNPLCTPPISPETAESMSAQQDASLQPEAAGGTASFDQLDVTLRWVLNTPPETPPELNEALPRVKPLLFPPLLDVNEVKEYRKGGRKLSAVVEAVSSP